MGQETDKDSERKPEADVKDEELDEVSGGRGHVVLTFRDDRVVDDTSARDKL